jgi:quercetin dioxygenase-like cupin family protein
MAEIVLEPGEVFEHRHSSTSTTTLIAGSVEFAMAGRARVLVEGETILVPADVPHVSTNIGQGPARIGCGLHAPSPEPPG